MSLFETGDIHLAANANLAGNTSEYFSWGGMKSRCLNPNAPAYSHYGGRGIKVCERWMDSFENFLADMGYKPSADYTLERVDVNGDYEPSNCRWATLLEQSNNRRNTVFVKYRGATSSLGDFCREYSLNYQATYRRIVLWRWPPEKVIATPSRGAAIKGTRKPRVLARNIGRLTPRDVIQIRMFRSIPQTTFARIIGVAPATIFAVRSGLTWGHLPQPIALLGGYQ